MPKRGSPSEGRRTAEPSAPLLTAHDLGLVLPLNVTGLFRFFVKCELPHISRLLDQVFYGSWPDRLFISKGAYYDI
jgi:hypothetical protein